MFCQTCGKELTPGASTCGACGARVYYPPSNRPVRDEIDQLSADLKQAGKELAVTAARLSKKLAEKAETVAKDPSGSAKSAARKVSQRLDDVAKEVDRIVNDL